MKNRSPSHTAHHRKRRTHQVLMFSALACALISFAFFWLIFIQSTVASPGVTMRQEIVAPESIASVSSQAISDAQSIILARPDRSLPNPAQFTLSLEGQMDELGGLTVSDANQKQSRIPVIRNPRPTFHGSVSVKDARILLEIHSPTSLSTILDIGDDGGWSWTVPEPLEPGEHYLYAVIFDRQASRILGQAALRFIYLPAGAVGSEYLQSADPAEPIPPSGYESGYILFDVRVAVPDRYKTVSPGEDLLAEFRLVNVATQGPPVDVTLHYRIVDRLNNIVLDESETVAVSVQQSFLKTFRTGIKLPAGTYRLEVELPYNDGRQSAYSSDTFEVEGAPVISFSGGVRMNLNFVLQALGLILTAFSLIAYYEFKQVESLARIIRQVSEDDLLRQRLVD